MATQMSPDGSTRSSSKGRLSFSLHSSVLHRNSSGKDVIRDVQVDKGTNTSRGSRKQGVEEMDSTHLPIPWDVAESSKDMSRSVYGFYERYEPKIQ